MIRRTLDFAPIGAPQRIAAAMLLLYLLQCVWLIAVETRRGLLPDGHHGLCIYHGLQQWKSGEIAGTPETLKAETIAGLPSAAHGGQLRVNAGYDVDRSPLYYLTCAAPFLVKPSALATESGLGQLWSAMPYLFFGLMLGGSLWYVSRRLYGNAGGYIALALYCFSPGPILAVAGAPSLGEMGAVWGAFGTIFTAIAVAHTLYAPREVVLWNSKRIFLLGLAMTLAIGTLFSLVPLVVVALALMLWVAPMRWRAGCVIWCTAAGVSTVLLLASYFFRPSMFWQGVMHARWADFLPAAFAMKASYATVARQMFAGAPALMLALPAALVSFIAWKRARYFGNTAPLIVAAVAFALMIASPDFPGRAFSLALLIFLFVFVAGVLADLMESRRGPAVVAATFGLLGAAALANFYTLLGLAFAR